MNINNWLAASAGIVSGMFFTGMALAASLPYTGGIALEKTEALARTSIPLPDGKPDALLALAMRHGSAKGYFSGRAAAAVKQKFRQDIPIFVEAVRMEEIKNKPGCNRVRLTFHTSPALSQTFPSE
ncbi:hypothetical protein OMC81_001554, partial [Neisseria gonorrhoeae]